VDKNTKSFDFSPIFLCKSSWDLCKKHNLLDDDSNPLELSAIKGGPWLQYFGYSNSLCTRATKAIINHASISKY